MDHLKLKINYEVSDSRHFPVSTPYLNTSKLRLHSHFLSHKLENVLEWVPLCRNNKVGFIKLSHTAEAYRGFCSMKPTRSIATPPLDSWYWPKGLRPVDSIWHPTHVFISPNTKPVEPIAWWLGHCSCGRNIAIYIKVTTSCVKR